MDLLYPICDGRFRLSRGTSGMSLKESGESDLERRETKAFLAEEAAAGEAPRHVEAWRV